MNRYKYLIVDGGMAADAAVQGIREADQNGSIGILSKDIDPPYRRFQKISGTERCRLRRPITTRQRMMLMC